MKLISDYNRFKLYKYKVEDLINDYEQLKKLRESIQAKYFSIYDELVEERLIEGELDVSDWCITRDNENETWDSEVRLMSEIKTNFDMAIKMIENGEAERALLMLKIGNKKTIKLSVICFGFKVNILFWDLDIFLNIG